MPSSNSCLILGFKALEDNGMIIRLNGKGYKCVLGMDHGNFTAGKDSEINLIKAYREVGNFK